MLKRGTWAKCANCGKATWYCAKHGCKPAVPKLLTVKAVNKALREAGYSEELYFDPCGEQYVFSGGESHKWMASGTGIYRLNRLTIEQWIQMRNELANRTYLLRTRDHAGALSSLICLSKKNN
jgi:hypothetical protein